MVAAAVFMGIMGPVILGTVGRRLLWLHKTRKVSDVSGTVVARDRQWTGRSYWTYPVVEFTTRDGTQVRRTFRQLARPTIGRQLQIVYDPSAPEGRRRWTRSGLISATSEPLIYSIWMVAWFWLEIAVGLALLAGSIFLTFARG